MTKFYDTSIRRSAKPFGMALRCLALLSTFVFGVGNLYADDEEDTTDSSSATEYSLAINYENGTFYRYSSGSYVSGSTSDNAKWESTSTSPQITLARTSSTENNMKPGTSSTTYAFGLYGGSSTTRSYTVSISDGYEITGYSFEYYSGSSSMSTFTVNGTSYDATVTDATTQEKVTLDANVQSFEIVVGGANTYIYFNSFTVYYVEVDTKELTYNVYLVPEDSSESEDESTEVDYSSYTLLETYTVTANIGSSYPTDGGLFSAFYTIDESSYPEGTVTSDGEDTINLTATATNLPFTPSEENDSTYYVMRVTTESTLIAGTSSSTPTNVSGGGDYGLNDCLWSFIEAGNFGYYYLYNRGAGAYGVTTDDGSSRYDLTFTATDSADATVFQILENTTSAATSGKSFSLMVKGSETHTCLNRSSNALTTYPDASQVSNTSTDGNSGSCLTVYAILDEDGFAFVFGDALEEFATDYGALYLTCLNGKNYVGLPTSLTDNLKAAMAAYLAGVVTSESDVTLTATSIDSSSWSADVAADMCAAFSAGETGITDLGILEFDADQLYRLCHFMVNLSTSTTASVDSNGYTGAYLTYSSEYLTSSPQCYDLIKDDPNAVWQFTADDSESSYYIYSPNLEQYIGQTSSSASNQTISMAESSDDAGIYTLNEGTCLAMYYFLDQTNTGSNKGLAADLSKGLSNRGATSGWDSNGWYLWFLEPADTLNATLSTVEDTADDGLGSGNYATIYYPWAVQIPDDVTAYSLSASTTSEEVTYLVLSEIEDGIVPAQTGVILKSEESTEPSYIILSSSDTELSSCLSGVYVETEASELSDDSSYEDIYIFATGEDGLAFYWLPSGTTTLAANKAYYKKESLSDATTESVIKFGFGSSSDEDVETGIALTELVESSSSESIYYDLSGRRVSKPTTGVYIRNGHKVILK